MRKSSSAKVKAANMISKLFIVSRQSGVIIDKDYRFDIDDNCELLFLDKVKAIKSGSIQPHFNSDGIHFYNICRSGVYFVACSKSDVSPVLVIELLSRFYHVCKDFCGVVTEQSVQANILLIYELLDELLNEGYVQLATTEKLRPYIQSEPVIILKERSPTNEMSSRVFGIETKVLPGSVAQMPVVQSSNESDARRNELFVDVVEKMVAVINKDGTVSRMEVNGSMNIKNFLTGCPQIKMALNEDLVISGGAQKGYGNQVQIDRCSFHKSVQQTDFASTRVLVLNPPIGEFSVMAYNVSGEMSLNQPFRLMTFIGDTDGSRDMLVTLRLHCDIPSRTDAVNVRLKLPVPAGVSSVSTKLGSDAQSTEFTESEKQIIWFIKKLPGKTEATAQFRLISQGSGTINRYEVGPIALEFEISGYTSSGLQLRYVKIQGAEKSQSRQQWIRHITVSDSYIFRT